MRDYSNQTIFIGIDVHKSTYSVTAICEQNVIKKDRLPACPKSLIAYFEKFFPNGNLNSAYEAGFSGFALHRELIQAGINNIVVHPASIEIASRDRVKTDKRDSLKIAIQLAAGRLRGINIPSQKREAFRSISRLREKLMKDRTRIGVQIKGFLNYMNLIDHKHTKRLNRKFVDDILELSHDCETSFYLKTMAKRWIETDLEIITIEKRLKSQAIEEANLERIYQSAPGIGAIVSRVLINELGNMSQFKNEKALYSYTGLTPQEYSSGEHTRQGHISRQGKPVLRRILVQAAWAAIRKDGKLKEAYERISQTAGKKRAIVGIARRLIGHIRSCLKKNEMYRYN